MAVKIAKATSESFCQSVLLVVFLFSRGLYLSTSQPLSAVCWLWPGGHDAADSHETMHRLSIKKVLATEFDSAVHYIAHCASKRLAVAKSTSSIIRVTSVDCMTQPVSK